VLEFVRKEDVEVFRIGVAARGGQETVIFLSPALPWLSWKADSLLAKKTSLA
jgi:hypothetical protein